MPEPDRSQLQLNVDTGVAGTVKVEILKADESPAPGFSEADAVPVKGNFIDKVVSWKGGSDVGSLSGKAVRLRFVMRDTKLYAFQFVQAP